MPATYNSEFVDRASSSPFPLDPAADQTFIPQELLLDASVYIPSSFSPPIFIIQIDGGRTDDQVRFTLADSRRRIVCHADCLYTASSAVFMDTYGRSMGVLVYDADQMVAFKGIIGSETKGFVAANTKLQSECYRFYDMNAAHTVVAVRNALTNKVNITFTGGLTRDEDGNMHLYGEQRDTNIALRSINSVSCQHAFLLAYVHEDYENESAIRIETSAGTIKIGKSRDF